MEIGSKAWELDMQSRRLKNEIDQKIQNYEQLKADLKKMEAAKIEVRFLINRLKNDLPESLDEVVKNLGKISDILNKNTSLESKAHRIARIISLKNEIKKLNHKNEKFQNCIDMIEQKTKDQKSLQFKNNLLKITLEGLEIEKQEAENNLKAYQEQKKILLSKCGKKLTDAKRLREEIDIMKQKIDKQNNLIQELEFKKKEKESKTIKYNKMS